MCQKLSRCVLPTASLVYLSQVVKPGWAAETPLTCLTAGTTSAHLSLNVQMHIAFPCMMCAMAIQIAQMEKTKRNAIPFPVQDFCYVAMIKCVHRYEILEKGHVKCVKALSVARMIRP